MDIFTTQLIRVVQMPIKPSNSRVKGPAKESSATQLTEDFDHLEYHEKYNGSENERTDQDENSEQTKDKNNNEKVTSKNTDDEPPHLDIYV